MNKIFDFIVVGSGIGGSTITHWLLKRNQNVGIIEKYSHSNNASSAAGCWVSPPIIRPTTHYHHFVSNSFQFSTQFYQNLFKTKENLPKYKDFYYSLGCWYYRPKNVSPDIWKNIKDKTPYQLIENRTNGNEIKYFIDQSLFFDKSYLVCDMLIEDDKKSVTIIHENVDTIQYDTHQNYWVVNNKYSTKKIILAPGNQLDLVHEKYIHSFIKQLYGEIIEVKSDIHIDHSIHGNIFISSNLPSSNHLLIGSSNISSTSLNEHILYKEREKLLNKFINTMNLNDKPLICSIKAGTRLYTHDSFPIAGELVNSELSLNKEPLIIHGKVIDDLVYIPNKFLFTAFGGKGFLTAPYLSYLLVKSIFDEPLSKEETNFLRLCSPARLFYKWARKDSHLL